MTRLKMIIVGAVCAVLASGAVALAATIIGTNGPDTLIGTTGNDNIKALGGNDRVLGLAGDDRIKGGDGNDRIEGDGECPPGTRNPDYCKEGAEGNDTIDGGEGDDTITGGRGKDRIDGKDGNDYISGGKGNDKLRGGGGNDNIFARDGVRDIINCGPGIDKVRADKQDQISRNCETVKIR